MHKKILYFLLLLSGISCKPIFAQHTESNLLTSIGPGFPYSPVYYSKAGLNMSVEYLRMLDLANGFALQIDYIEFKNNPRTVKEEVRTIRAGYRHRFTEKFYYQISLGISTFKYIPRSVAGSGELRTGFLFPLKGYYSLDIAGFISQTTKEFGWIGLKVGLMYSFKRKEKKSS